jgi:hypothetical protein
MRYEAIERGITTGSEAFESAPSPMSGHRHVEEVLAVGITHHKFGLLRDWSDPTRRYKAFKAFEIDTYIENIIGVGLPLFFDYHVLPMFCALGALLVAAHASHAAGFSTAAKDTRHHGPFVKATHEFAYNLWLGLAVFWISMVVFAWICAVFTCRHSVEFDQANSTMSDFAVHIKGLPENFVDEEKLLALLKKTFGDCGVEPIGVSICYDQRHLGSRIDDMLERLITESDIELYEDLHSSDAEECLGPGESSFGYGAKLVDERHRRSDDEEKAELSGILKTMRGGGSAYAVFKYKSQAARVCLMYNGFWLEDSLTFEQSHREMWLDALRPRGISEYHMADLRHIWPAGKGIIKHELCIYQGGERHILPAGTRVLLPDDCNNLEQVPEGHPIQIERRIEIGHAEGEPTTLLWHNFGTRHRTKVDRTIRALLFTLVVFGLIVCLVYYPSAVIIDRPYARAQTSPKEATMQIKGFLIGTANNVLGSVMGMQSWGIGFWSRSSLDLWVMLFSLATTLFNSAVVLWTAFEHAVSDVQSSFVRLHGVEYIGDQSYKSFRDYVNKEITLSGMLFDMMVPGWLFSGFITGQVIGFIVPWIQNYILLHLVFRLRCLPYPVNKLITLLIPYNPDPAQKLSARKAENIFSPPLLSLAWEYADKIVNPSICLLSLFFISPHMWAIFPWLLQWACFMFLYFRYFLMWFRRKSTHDSRSLQICGLYMWFIPISIVAAAWTFWAVRLNYFSNFLLVPIAFILSAIIYWTGLLIIIPLDVKIGVEKDAEYYAVDARLLYNWFNCNAIRVLKARYGFLHTTPSDGVPFVFGKEYLVICKRSKCNDESVVLRSTTPQSWQRRKSAANKLSLSDRVYFGVIRFRKYVIPGFCFATLVCARGVYYYNTLRGE